MKKIKVNEWKIIKEDKSEGTESLVTMLSVLVSNKDPKLMPRGLDKFRLYNRLAKAFDKANDKKVLELEEVDYKFLKDTLETDLPAIWGTNPNMMNAVEDFVNAKEE